MTDVGDDEDEPFSYEGSSQTVAGEVDWDLTYRWTLRVLASVERRQGEYTLADGGSDKAEAVAPKLASGVTISF